MRITRKSGYDDFRSDDGDDYAIVQLGTVAELVRKALKDGYPETATWLTELSGVGAWIETIEVESKGRGRGSMMMTAVLEHARMSGASFAFAHAHADPGHGENLARWYTRQGFKRLGNLDYMPLYAIGL